jgi:NTE family protein
MKVGLVLGGGGARGLAHIGVLRALEERHIEPVAIAGCSMGGIIGALVAYGVKSNEIYDAFRELKPHRLLDFSKGGALIGGRGIAEQIEAHLPKTFADLNLPLRVTAVDVQSGRIVSIWEGDLVPALRATSAVPGLFTPVDYDGRVLIDGGLLNNVPVDEMRSMTHEPVVAVDVTVPPNRKLVFEDDRSFWEKLKEPFQAGKRPLFIELLIKAYDIPAAVLNNIQLATYPPEYLIRPALDPDLKLEDFKRIDEAVEAGYREAAAVLDAPPAGDEPVSG